MQIPHFSECQHPLVQSLAQRTDQELLTLFQRHPLQGQYFVAIFCRYGSIVYTLIHHAVRSPVQAEYLFSMVWKHIHHELRELDISSSSCSGNVPETDVVSTFNLQTWLVSATTVCVNHAKLPPVESIHYSLAEASPPLLYYLEQALDQLSPLHRFVVLMTQTFHWNPTRIAAHLHAEGTMLSETEVRQSLIQGYQSLMSILPSDICEIYRLSDGVKM
ncbi:MAG: sigma-70 family RNA polymerase sigma factor [Cyanobacteria bacterium P01_E01_bin.6]